ncbi:hypothetical protein FRC11_009128 [Ceratobasidium sp. 423]|nr:hypothetical protein FRC11_009128 [Ceratobasidium sp. 423]
MQGKEALRGRDNEGTNLNVTQLTSVNVQWYVPINTSMLVTLTRAGAFATGSTIGKLGDLAPRGQGWQTVFTLNEPDLPGSATSPVDAAKWYIQWINPLNITKALPAVTSSAAAGQGLNWVDEFIVACAGQCYFDYINLHWYGSSFEDFKAHIEGAHNRFPAYRLVITEFALLPPATRADQTAFLNTAMAFLDNTTYVEHYAIFLATSPTLITTNNGGSDYAGTTSTLFSDDGSLTLNGVAYRG